MIYFIFFLNYLNDKEKMVKIVNLLKDTISFNLGNLDTHLF